jgi:hypothetical protein
VGASISWAAVQGSTPEEVCAALGLRATGERLELPEAAVTGAELAGGWYMVVSDHDGLELASDRILARLSILGEAVACFVEEHNMCSAAVGWRNGHNAWRVLHEFARGVENLEAEGDLPPEFTQIRDERLARQQVVQGGEPKVDDLFDIPIALVHAIIGYRHDEIIPEMGDDAFEVLEPASTKREAADPRPWWQRIFRRR